MSEYRNAAWSYDPKDLELDKETGLPFVPTKKEIDLFKKEKTNMYRGTWMVCFMYGLSALILLYIIFFTQFGKTYVYDKFLPAVITYVVGAIFIILYLIIAIFELKPRKIGKSVASSVCPDYWKLERSNSTEDLYIKIKEKELSSTIDKKDLNYKCVPDENVYGKTKNEIKNMKNDIYTHKLYSSTLHSSDKYTTDSLLPDKIDEKEIMYLYTNGKNESASGNYEYNGLSSSSELVNYAEISGLYDLKNANADGSINKTDLKSTSLFAGTGFNYNANKPLICSEVYPKILNSLENDIYNKDKLKCEYAKACNVSWSHLDCYENTD